MTKAWPLRSAIGLCEDAPDYEFANGERDYAWNKIDVRFKPRMCRTLKQVVDVGHIAAVEEMTIGSLQRVTAHRDSRERPYLYHDWKGETICIDGV